MFVRWLILTTARFTLRATLQNQWNFTGQFGVNEGVNERQVNARLNSVQVFDPTLTSD
jgi:hypothetical protein